MQMLRIHTEILIGLQVWIEAATISGVTNELKDAQLFKVRITVAQQTGASLSPTTAIIMYM